MGSRKTETLIGKLELRFVYYLVFLLNPNSRQNSTILSKAKTTEPQFKNIFATLPTQLKSNQMFITQLFKCQPLKLKDIKRLLIDHFQTELTHFFADLKENGLKLGDLYLHDNYWLSSKDCKGKGCKDHSIDDLNSGKYLCKILKECKNDYCVTGLRIDLKNTIKAKFASSKINAFKNDVFTPNDMCHMYEEIKNTSYFQTLPIDQQEEIRHYYCSNNLTMEQMIYSYYDSSDDENNKNPRSFKHLNQVDMKNMENSIMEKMENMEHLGLTTKHFTRTHTNDWKKRVFGKNVVRKKNENDTNLKMGGGAIRKNKKKVIWKIERGYKMRGGDGSDSSSNSDSDSDSDNIQKGGILFDSLFSSHIPEDREYIDGWFAPTSDKFYILHNGDKYIGQFTDNSPYLPNGYGMLSSYNNEIYYKGNFDNGKITGSGILVGIDKHQNEFKYSNVKFKNDVIQSDTGSSSVLSIKINTNPIINNKVKIKTENLQIFNDYFNTVFKKSSFNSIINDTNFDLGSIDKTIYENSTDIPKTTITQTEMINFAIISNMLYNTDQVSDAPNSTQTTPNSTPKELDAQAISEETQATSVAPAISEETKQISVDTINTITDILSITSQNNDGKINDNQLIDIIQYAQSFTSSIIAIKINEYTKNVYKPHSKFNKEIELKIYYKWLTIFLYRPINDFYNFLKKLSIEIEKKLTPEGIDSNGSDDIYSMSSVANLPPISKKYYTDEQYNDFMKIPNGRGELLLDNLLQIEIKIYNFKYSVRNPTENVSLFIKNLYANDPTVNINDVEIDKSQYDKFNNQINGDHDNVSDTFNSNLITEQMSLDKYIDYIAQTIYKNKYGMPNTYNDLYDLNSRISMKQYYSDINPEKTEKIKAEIETEEEEKQLKKQLGEEKEEEKREEKEEEKREEEKEEEKEGEPQLEEEKEEEKEGEPQLGEKAQLGEGEQEKTQLIEEKLNKQFEIKFTAIQNELTNIKNILTNFFIYEIILNQNEGFHPLPYNFYYEKPDTILTKHIKSIPSSDFFTHVPYWDTINKLYTPNDETRIKEDLSENVMRNLTTAPQQLKDKLNNMKSKLFDLFAENSESFKSLYALYKEAEDEHKLQDKKIEIISFEQCKNNSTQIELPSKENMNKVKYAITPFNKIIVKYSAIQFLNEIIKILWSEFNNKTEEQTVDTEEDYKDLPKLIKNFEENSPTNSIIINPIDTLSLNLKLKNKVIIDNLITKFKALYINEEYYLPLVKYENILIDDKPLDDILIMLNNIKLSSLNGVYNINILKYITFKTATHETQFQNTNDILISLFIKYNYILIGTISQILKHKDENQTFIQFIKEQLTIIMQLYGTQWYTRISERFKIQSKDKTKSSEREILSLEIQQIADVIKLQYISFFQKSIITNENEFNKDIILDNTDDFKPDDIYWKKNKNEIINLVINLKNIIYYFYDFTYIESKKQIHVSKTINAILEEYHINICLLDLYSEVPQVKPIYQMIDTINMRELMLEIKQNLNKCTSINENIIEQNKTLNAEIEITIQTQKTYEEKFKNYNDAAKIVIIKQIEKERQKQLDKEKRLSRENELKQIIIKLREDTKIEFVNTKTAVRSGVRGLISEWFKQNWSTSNSIRVFIDSLNNNGFKFHKKYSTTDKDWKICKDLIDVRTHPINIRPHIFDKITKTVYLLDINERDLNKIFRYSMLNNDPEPEQNNIYLQPHEYIIHNLDLNDDDIIPEIVQGKRIDDVNYGSTDGNGICNVFNKIIERNKQILLDRASAAAEKAKAEAARLEIERAKAAGLETERAEAARLEAEKAEAAILKTERAEEEEDDDDEEEEEGKEKEEGEEKEEKAAKSPTVKEQSVNTETIGSQVSSPVENDTTQNARKITSDRPYNNHNINGTYKYRSFEFNRDTYNIYSRYDNKYIYILVNHMDKVNPEVKYCVIYSFDKNIKIENWGDNMKFPIAYAKCEIDNVYEKLNWVMLDASNQYVPTNITVTISEETEEEEEEEKNTARLEAERAEAARLEAEKAEAARLEAEKAEAARLEAERAEAARLEAEKKKTRKISGAKIFTINKTMYNVNGEYTYLGVNGEYTYFGVNTRPEVTNTLIYVNTTSSTINKYYLLHILYKGKVRQVVSTCPKINDDNRCINFKTTDTGNTIAAMDDNGIWNIYQEVLTRPKKGLEFKPLESMKVEIIQTGGQNSIKEDTEDINDIDIYTDNDTKSSEKPIISHECFNQNMLTEIEYMTHNTYANNDKIQFNTEDDHLKFKSWLSKLNNINKNLDVTISIILNELKLTRQPRWKNVLSEFSKKTIMKNVNDFITTSYETTKNTILSQSKRYYEYRVKTAKKNLEQKEKVFNEWNKILKIWNNNFVEAKQIVGNNFNYTFDNTFKLNYINQLKLLQEIQDFDKKYPLLDKTSIINVIQETQILNNCRLGIDKFNEAIIPFKDAIIRMITAIIISKKTKLQTNISDIDNSNGNTPNFSKQYEDESAQLEAKIKELTTKYTTITDKMTELKCNTPTDTSKSDCEIYQIQLTYINSEIQKTQGEILLVNSKLSWEKAKDMPLIIGNMFYQKYDSYTKMFEDFIQDVPATTYFEKVWRNMIIMAEQALSKLTTPLWDSSMKWANSKTTPNDALNMTNPIAMTKSGISYMSSKVKSLSYTSANTINKLSTWFNEILYKITGMNIGNGIINKSYQFLKEKFANNPLITGILGLGTVIALIYAIGGISAIGTIATGTVSAAVNGLGMLKNATSYSTILTALGLGSFNYLAPQEMKNTINMYLTDGFKTLIKYSLPILDKIKTVAFIFLRNPITFQYVLKELVLYRDYMCAQIKTAFGNVKFSDTPITMEEAAQNTLNSVQAFISSNPIMQFQELADFKTGINILQLTTQAGVGFIPMVGGAIGGIISYCMNVLKKTLAESLIEVANLNVVLQNFKQIKYLMDIFDCIYSPLIIDLTGGVFDSQLNYIRIYNLDNYFPEIIATQAQIAGIGAVAGGAIAATATVAAGTAAAAGSTALTPLTGGVSAVATAEITRQTAEATVKNTIRGAAIGAAIGFELAKSWNLIKLNGEINQFEPVTSINILSQFEWVKTFTDEVGIVQTGKIPKQLTNKKMLLNEVKDIIGAQSSEMIISSTTGIYPIPNTRQNLERLIVLLAKDNPPFTLDQIKLANLVYPFYEYTNTSEMCEIDFTGKPKFEIVDPFNFYFEMTYEDVKITKTNSKNLLSDLSDKGATPKNVILTEVELNPNYGKNKLNEKKYTKTSTNTSTPQTTNIGKDVLFSYYTTFGEFKYKLIEVKYVNDVMLNTNTIVEFRMAYVGVVSTFLKKINDFMEANIPSIATKAVDIVKSLYEALTKAYDTLLQNKHIEPDAPLYSLQTREKNVIMNYYSQHRSDNITAQVVEFTDSLNLFFNFAYNVHSNWEVSLNIKIKSNKTRDITTKEKDNYIKMHAFLSQSISNEKRFHTIENKMDTALREKNKDVLLQKCAQNPICWKEYQYQQYMKSLLYDSVHKNSKYIRDYIDQFDTAISKIDSWLDDWIDTKKKNDEEFKQNIELFKNKVIENTLQLTEAEKELLIDDDTHPYTKFAMQYKRYLNDMSEYKETRTKINADNVESNIPILDSEILTYFSHEVTDPDEYTPARRLFDKMNENINADIATQSTYLPNEKEKNEIMNAFKKLNIFDIAKQLFLYLIRVLGKIASHANAFVKKTTGFDVGKTVKRELVTAAKMGLRQTKKISAALRNTVDKIEKKLTSGERDVLGELEQRLVESEKENIKQNISMDLILKQKWIKIINCIQISKLNIIKEITEKQNITDAKTYFNTNWGINEKYINQILKDVNRSNLNTLILQFETKNVDNNTTINTKLQDTVTIDANEFAIMNLRSTSIIQNITKNIILNYYDNSKELPAEIDEYLFDKSKVDFMSKIYKTIIASENNTQPAFIFTFQMFSQLITTYKIDTDTNDPFDQHDIQILNGWQTKKITELNQKNISEQEADKIDQKLLIAERERSGLSEEVLKPENAISSNSQYKINKFLFLQADFHNIYLKNIQSCLTANILINDLIIQNIKDTYKSIQSSTFKLNQVEFNDITEKAMFLYPKNLIGVDKFIALENLININQIVAQELLKNKINNYEETQNNLILIKQIMATLINKHQNINTLIIYEQNLNSSVKNDYYFMINQLYKKINEVRLNKENPNKKLGWINDIDVLLTPSPEPITEETKPINQIKKYCEEKLTEFNKFQEMINSLLNNNTIEQDAYSYMNIKNDKHKEINNIIELIDANDNETKQYYNLFNSNFISNIIKNKNFINSNSEKQFISKKKIIQIKSFNLYENKMNSEFIELIDSDITTRSATKSKAETIQMSYSVLKDKIDEYLQKNPLSNSNYYTITNNNVTIYELNYDYKFDDARDVSNDCNINNTNFVKSIEFMKKIDFSITDGSFNLRTDNNINTFYITYDIDEIYNLEHIKKANNKIVNYFNSSHEPIDDINILASTNIKLIKDLEIKNIKLEGIELIYYNFLKEINNYYTIILKLKRNYNIKKNVIQNQLYIAYKFGLTTDKIVANKISTETKLFTNKTDDEIINSEINKITDFDLKELYGNYNLIKWDDANINTDNTGVVNYLGKKAFYDSNNQKLNNDTDNTGILDKLLIPNHITCKNTLQRDQLIKDYFIFFTTRIQTMDDNDTMSYMNEKRSNIERIEEALSDDEVFSKLNINRRKFNYTNLLVNLELNSIIPFHILFFKSISDTGSTQKQNLLNDMTNGLKGLYNQFQKFALGALFREDIEFLIEQINPSYTSKILLKPYTGLNNQSNTSVIDINLNTKARLLRDTQIFEKYSEIKYWTKHLSELTFDKITRKDKYDVSQLSTLFTDQNVKEKYNKIDDKDTLIKWFTSSEYNTIGEYFNTLNTQVATVTDKQQIIQKIKDDLKTVNNAMEETHTQIKSDNSDEYKSLIDEHKKINDEIEAISDISPNTIKVLKNIYIEIRLNEYLTSHFKITINEVDQNKQNDEDKIEKAELTVIANNIGNEQITRQEIANILIKMNSKMSGLFNIVKSNGQKNLKGNVSQKNPNLINYAEFKAYCISQLGDDYSKSYVTTDADIINKQFISQILNLNGNIEIQTNTQSYIETLYKSVIYGYQSDSQLNSEINSIGKFINMINTITTTSETFKRAAEAKKTETAPVEDIAPLIKTKIPPVTSNQIILLQMKNWWYEIDDIINIYAKYNTNKSEIIPFNVKYIFDKKETIKLLNNDYKTIVNNHLNLNNKISPELINEFYKITQNAKTYYLNKILQYEYLKAYQQYNKQNNYKLTPMNFEGIHNFIHKTDNSQLYLNDIVKFKKSLKTPSYFAFLNYFSSNKNDNDTEQSEWINGNITGVNEILNDDFTISYKYNITELPFLKNENLNQIIQTVNNGQLLLFKRDANYNIGTFVYHKLQNIVGQIIDIKFIPFILSQTNNWWYENDDYELNIRMDDLSNFVKDRNNYKEYYNLFTKEEQWNIDSKITVNSLNMSDLILNYNRKLFIKEYVDENKKEDRENNNIEKNKEAIFNQNYKREPNKYVKIYANKFIKGILTAINKISISYSAAISAEARKYETAIPIEDDDNIFNDNIKKHENGIIHVGSMYTTIKYIIIKDIDDKYYCINKTQTIITTEFDYFLTYCQKYWNKNSKTNISSIFDNSLFTTYQRILQILRTQETQDIIGVIIENDINNEKTSNKFNYKIRKGNQNYFITKFVKENVIILKPNYITNWEIQPVEYGQIIYDHKQYKTYDIDNISNIQLLTDDIINKLVKVKYIKNTENINLLKNTSSDKMQKYEIDDKILLNYNNLQQKYYSLVSGIQQNMQICDIIIMILPILDVYSNNKRKNNLEISWYEKRKDSYIKWYDARLKEFDAWHAQIEADKLYETSRYATEQDKNKQKLEEEAIERRKIREKEKKQRRFAYLKKLQDLSQKYSREFDKKLNSELNILTVDSSHDSPQSSEKSAFDTENDVDTPIQPNTIITQDEHNHIEKNLKEFMNNKFNFKDQKDKDKLSLLIPTINNNGTKKHYTYSKICVKLNLTVNEQKLKLELEQNKHEFNKMAQYTNSEYILEFVSNNIELKDSPGFWKLSKIIDGTIIAKINCNSPQNIDDAIKTAKTPVVKTLVAKTPIETSAVNPETKLNISADINYITEVEILNNKSTNTINWLTESNTPISIVSQIIKKDVELKTYDKVMLYFQYILNNIIDQSTDDIKDAEDFIEKYKQMLIAAQNNNLNDEQLNIEPIDDKAIIHSMENIENDKPFIISKYEYQIGTNSVNTFGFGEMHMFLKEEIEKSTVGSNPDNNNTITAKSYEEGGATKWKFEDIPNYKKSLFTLRYTYVFTSKVENDQVKKVTTIQTMELVYMNDAKLLDVSHLKGNLKYSQNNGTVKITPKFYLQYIWNEIRGEYKKPQDPPDDKITHIETKGDNIQNNYDIIFGLDDNNNLVTILQSSATIINDEVLIPNFVVEEEEQEAEAKSAAAPAEAKTAPAEAKSAETKLTAADLIQKKNVAIEKLKDATKNLDDAEKSLIFANSNNQSAHAINHWKTTIIFRRKEIQEATAEIAAVTAAETKLSAEAKLAPPAAPVAAEAKTAAAEAAEEKPPAKAKLAAEAKPAAAESKTEKIIDTNAPYQGFKTTISYLYENKEYKSKFCYITHTKCKDTYYRFLCNGKTLPPEITFDPNLKIKEYERLSQAEIKPLIPFFEKCYKQDMDIYNTNTNSAKINKRYMLIEINKNDIYIKEFALTITSSNLKGSVWNCQLGALSDTETILNMDDIVINQGKIIISHLKPQEETTWNYLTNTISTVYSNVENIVKDGQNVITTYVNDLGQKVMTKVDEFGRIIETVIETTKDLFEKTGIKIQNFVSQQIESGIVMIKDVIDGAGNVVRTVLDEAGNVWNTIKSSVKGLGIKLAEYANKFCTYVRDETGKLWQKTKNYMDDTFKYFKLQFNTINTYIGSIVEKVVNFSRKATQQIYAVGERIYGNIQTTFKTIVTTIVDVVNGVSYRLLTGVTDVKYVVTEAIVGVRNWISDRIVDLRTFIEQFVSIIKHNLNVIYNFLNDVVNSAKKQFFIFKEQFMSYCTGMMNIIKVSGLAIYDLIKKTIANYVTSVVNNVMGFMNDVKNAIFEDPWYVAYKNTLTVLLTEQINQNLIWAKYHGKDKITKMLQIYYTNFKTNKLTYEKLTEQFKKCNTYELIKANFVNIDVNQYNVIYSEIPTTEGEIVTEISDYNSIKTEFITMYNANNFLIIQPLIQELFIKNQNYKNDQSEILNLQKYENDIKFNNCMNTAINQLVNVNDFLNENTWTGSIHDIKQQEYLNYYANATHFEKLLDIAKKNSNLTTGFNNAYNTFVNQQKNKNDSDYNLNFEINSNLLINTIKPDYMNVDGKKSKYSINYHVSRDVIYNNIVEAQTANEISDAKDAEKQAKFDAEINIEVEKDPKVIDARKIAEKAKLIGNIEQMGIANDKVEEVVKNVTAYIRNNYTKNEPIKTTNSLQVKNKFINMLLKLNFIDDFKNLDKNLTKILNNDNKFQTEYSQMIKFNFGFDQNQKIKDLLEKEETKYIYNAYNSSYKEKKGGIHNITQRNNPKQFHKKTKRNHSNRFHEMKNTKSDKYNTGGDKYNTGGKITRREIKRQMYKKTKRFSNSNKPYKSTKNLQHKINKYSPKIYKLSEKINHSNVKNTKRFLQNMKSRSHYTKKYPETNVKTPISNSMNLMKSSIRSSKFANKNGKGTRYKQLPKINYKNTPINRVKHTPINRMKHTPVNRMKHTPVNRMKHTPVNRMKHTPVNRVKNHKKTPIVYSATSNSKQTKVNRVQKIEDKPTAIRYKNNHSKYASKSSSKPRNTTKQNRIQVKAVISDDE